MVLDVEHQSHLHEKMKTSAQYSQPARASRCVWIARALVCTDRSGWSSFQARDTSSSYPDNDCLYPSLSACIVNTQRPSLPACGGQLEHAQQAYRLLVPNRAIFSWTMSSAFWFLQGLPIRLLADQTYSGEAAREVQQFLVRST